MTTKLGSCTKLRPAPYLATPVSAAFTRSTKLRDIYSWRCPLEAPKAGSNPQINTLRQRR